MRQLEDGLTALGLTLNATAKQRLLDYLSLLARWNRTYNLTAVRDPQAMITRHLLDSLSVASYVRGPRVADLGTGAGLPGIPLAVAMPRLSFVLVDRRARKLHFVRQAVVSLGLSNVETVHSRIEQFRPLDKFDTLITRAVGNIPDMLTAARHLCGLKGRLLVMKGANPHIELNGISQGFAVDRVVTLHVPGLDAKRSLVIITPHNNTGGNSTG